MEDSDNEEIFRVKKKKCTLVSSDNEDEENNSEISSTILKINEEKENIDETEEKKEIMKSVERKPFKKIKLLLDDDDDDDDVPNTEANLEVSEKFDNSSLHEEAKNKVDYLDLARKPLRKIRFNFDDDSETGSVNESKASGNDSAELIGKPLRKIRLNFDDDSKTGSVNESKASGNDSAELIGKPLRKIRLNFDDDSKTGSVNESKASGNDSAELIGKPLRKIRLNFDDDSKTGSVNESKASGNDSAELIGKPLRKIRLNFDDDSKTGSVNESKASGNDSAELTGKPLRKIRLNFDDDSKTGSVNESKASGNDSAELIGKPLRKIRLNFDDDSKTGSVNESKASGNDSAELIGKPLRKIRLNFDDDSKTGSVNESKASGNDSAELTGKPLRKIRLNFDDDSETGSVNESKASGNDSAELTGKHLRMKLINLSKAKNPLDSKSEKYSHSDSEVNSADSGNEDNLDQNEDSDLEKEIYKSLWSDDENEESVKEKLHPTKTKQLKKQSRTLKEVKAKKDELVQIHSENQRLVRESAVRLPYHKPERMTLEEFLKRREKNRIPASLLSKPPRTTDIIQMQDKNKTGTGNSNSVLELHSNIINKNEDCKKLLPAENHRSSQSGICQDVKRNLFGKPSDGKENLNIEDSKEDTNEFKMVLSSEDSFTEEKTNNETENISKLPEKLDLCEVKSKLKQMCGNHIPRLSGSPNSIIEFEDDKPNKSKVHQFIEKFVKHADKSQTVSKEVFESKKEKGKSLFDFEAAKDSKFNLPGAKLVHLKELLRVKIDERKEAITKKRQETHQLENEEGFEEEKDEMVDSEAELTDQTDTDEEEEITDDEYTDSEEEEELFGLQKTKKKTSVFVDDEAAEDDDDDEEEVEEEYDEPANENDDTDEELPDVLGIDLKSKSNINNNIVSSTQLEPNKEPANQIETSMLLTAEQKETKENEESEFALCLESETEENFLDPEIIQPTSPLLEEASEKLDENGADLPNASKRNDSSFMNDSSCELGRSTIPPYQPGGGLKYGGHIPSTTESDFEDWFSSSAFKSQSIQETQNFKKDAENSSIVNKNKRSDLLCIEEEENANASKLNGLSQFSLMGDGIKSNFVPNENRCPTSLEDILDNNFGFTKKSDVLSVCSGSFPDTFDGPRGLEASQMESCNTQDLLALCSGKFDDSQVLPAENDNNLSDISIEMSNKKKRKRFKRLVQCSDSETEEKFDSNDSDNEAGSIESGDENENTKFSGFLNDEVGGLRKEFIEDEAELSGSEASSDEEEEDDENDELEEDDLCFDEQISEDELKNQVERIHHKVLLDEDKRELLLLQEHYLRNGDLHSDGQGRQRKFRWKHIDDSLDIGISDNSSGDEEEERDDENWRVQRFEREKWLQEQMENGNADMLSPKNTKLSDLTNKIENALKQDPDTKKPSHKSTIKSYSSSFLAKGKEFLNRLAMNLKKEDDSVGRRCTKSIIFTATNIHEQRSEDHVVKRKLNETNLSQNKRTKLSISVHSESKLSVKSSIFDYLEKR